MNDTNTQKGANFYKHGLSHTKLHRVWWGMIERCYRDDHKSFLDYGGRGIKVCDEWRFDFQAFHDWAMANGYKEGLCIDRIDNNGNYEPSNCRWVSQSQNARNRRTARVIEYDGVSHSLVEWSEITGLHADTITERLKMGWTIEEALTTKNNGRYKRNECRTNQREVV